MNKDILINQVEEFLVGKPEGFYKMPLTHEWATVKGDYNKKFDGIGIHFHNNPHLEIPGNVFKNGKFYCFYSEASEYATNTAYKEYAAPIAHKEANKKIEKASSLEDKIEEAIRFLNLSKKNEWNSGKSSNTFSFSSLSSQKVNITFYHSNNFDINIDLLGEDELFYLLDREDLFWRDYEKFEILFKINQLKNPNPICSYFCTELLPCIGRVKMNIGGYEHQFPFTKSSKLKKLYEKYDYIGVNSSIEHNSTSFCAGLFGYKFSKNANPKDIVKDPSNWIEVKNFDFGDLDISKLYGSHRYGDWSAGGNDISAFAFKNNMINLPNKGKLSLYWRLLDVKFGKQDWYSFISDKSYNTTANGFINSYSGSGEFEFENHIVKIWGTSSTGDAWTAYDGSVFYEIINK